jgi:hypothetical protein
MPSSSRVEKESQREVDDHEQQPQDHEPFGPALLPQPRQRDRRDGIQHNDGGDQPDVRRMVGVFHDPGQLWRKQQREYEKNDADGGHRAPYVRKDRPLFRFAAGLSRKAEITGFEAHRQQHQHERDQRVEVGDDSVLADGHHAGQVREQQVIQETGHDRP